MPTITIEQFIDAAKESIGYNATTDVFNFLTQHTLTGSLAGGGVKRDIATSLGISTEALTALPQQWELTPNTITALTGQIFSPDIPLNVKPIPVTDYCKMIGLSDAETVSIITDIKDGHIPNKLVTKIREHNKEYHEDDLPQLQGVDAHEVENKLTEIILSIKYGEETLRGQYNSDTVNGVATQDKVKSSINNVDAEFIGLTDEEKAHLQGHSGGIATTPELPNNTGDYAALPKLSTRYTLPPHNTDQDDIIYPGHHSTDPKPTITTFPAHEDNNDSPMLYATNDALKAISLGAAGGAVLTTMLALTPWGRAISVLCLAAEAFTLPAQAATSQVENSPFVRIDTIQPQDKSQELPLPDPAWQVTTETGEQFTLKQLTIEHTETDTGSTLQWRLTGTLNATEDNAVDFFIDAMDQSTADKLSDMIDAKAFIQASSGILDQQFDAIYAEAKEQGGADFTLDKEDARNAFNENVKNILLDKLNSIKNTRTINKNKREQLAKDIKHQLDTGLVACQGIALLYRAFGDNETAVQIMEVGSAVYTIGIAIAAAVSQQYLISASQLFKGINLLFDFFQGRPNPTEILAKKIDQLGLELGRKLTVMHNANYQQYRSIMDALGKAEKSRLLYFKALYGRQALLSKQFMDLQKSVINMRIESVDEARRNALLHAGDLLLLRNDYLSETMPAYTDQESRLHLIKLGSHIMSSMWPEFNGLYRTTDSNDTMTMIFSSIETTLFSLGSVVKYYQDHILPSDDESLPDATKVANPVIYVIALTTYLSVLSRLPDEIINSDPLLPALTNNLPIYRQIGERLLTAYENIFSETILHALLIEYEVELRGITETIKGPLERCIAVRKNFIDNQNSDTQHYRVPSEISESNDYTVTTKKDFSQMHDYTRDYEHSHKESSYRLSPDDWFECRRSQKGVIYRYFAKDDDGEEIHIATEKFDIQLSYVAKRAKHTELNWLEGPELHNAWYPARLHSFRGHSNSGGFNHYPGEDLMQGKKFSSTFSLTTDGDDLLHRIQEATTVDETKSNFQDLIGEIETESGEVGSVIKDHLDELHALHTKIVRILTDGAYPIGNITLNSRNELKNALLFRLIDHRDDPTLQALSDEYTPFDKTNIVATIAALKQIRRFAPTANLPYESEIKTAIAMLETWEDSITERKNAADEANRTHAGNPASFFPMPGPNTTSMESLAQLQAGQTGLSIEAQLSLARDIVAQLEAEAAMASSHTTGPGSQN